MLPVLNPYLNFNGNAAEAMRFYQAVLGGELRMQTFGEAKMAQTPGAENLIVHATLKSESLSLMASDTDPSRKAQFGDNIHMSITGDDHPKLAGIFNGLSKGGRVDMPLAKQFWGDTFGMLTDRFGVHWMVNIAAQPQG
jgi:PhnB protein